MQESTNLQSNCQHFTASRKCDAFLAATHSSAEPFAVRQAGVCALGLGLFTSLLWCAATRCFLRGHKAVCWPRGTLCHCCSTRVTPELSSGAGPHSCCPQGDQGVVLPPTSAWPGPNWATHNPCMNEHFKLGPISWLLFKQENCRLQALQYDLCLIFKGNHPVATWGVNTGYKWTGKNQL